MKRWNVKRYQRLGEYKAILNLEVQVALLKISPYKLLNLRFGNSVWLILSFQFPFTLRKLSKNVNKKCIDSIMVWAIFLWSNNSCRFARVVF